MTTEDFPARLAAAWARLASLQPAVIAGAPWPLAERFDHTPEASWGPPEVLAHLAEMMPYWLGEVERILAGPAGSVPFGRIGTDANRIAIIERDRTLPAGELFERIEIGLDRWTTRVQALTADEWTRLGSHPTRGDMSVAAIVERMIASHTEEHAEQLEGLLGASAAS
jgi:DinB family protein